MTRSHPPAAPSPQDPADSRAFLAFLEEIRPSVDGALDRLVPPDDERPERIHQAMRYSLFAGGKRVRPALVLATGDAFGVPREHLLPAAAALEMIHTYSLIHDDLPSLDDDDLRRGRPTAHRHFDEATAILAGDALLTLGLTTLAAEPAALDPEARRRTVELVGRAIGTRGMIGGQVDDLEAERAWPADPRAMLEAIHRRKTGALLVVSIRCAGAAAGVSDAVDRDLTALGEALGLLFQIGDDILDVEGTSEELGKTAGKDAAARKLTYPGLYGLDAAKRKFDDTRDRALALAARLPRDGGLFPSLVHYLWARDR